MCFVWNKILRETPIKVWLTCFSICRSFARHDGLVNLKNRQENVDWSGAELKDSENYVMNQIAEYC